MQLLPEADANCFQSGQHVAKHSTINDLTITVEKAVRAYLKDLDGELPCDLFDTVISQIEKPLLQTVLEHCENNQSRTATYLGINRGTLRKKIKQHQIET